MAKHVKMVFDGRGYWLLWHWQSFTPAPETFPGGFSFASGPFENREIAKEAVTDEWTLVDYDG